METGRRRSGELTPAQHAAIRQQLVLLPIYIWTVYAWGIFFQHLPVPPFSNDTFVGRDFVHFYVQGVITRAHDAHALYDIDAMAAVVDRVLPVPLAVRFPPVYGPQVGLLFYPLAMLSYLPALLLWMVITIAGYAMCVFLVWKTTPTLRDRRWMTAALAMGAVGLHFTLAFAQVSLIGLICFTALWLALRRRWMFAAGVAVGALAYKPQLAIVAAFVFVFAREWRVVAGAIAAVAVRIGAAWLYWGGAIFGAYVGALQRLPGVIDAMEPDKQLMHSWRSLALQLGISSSAATTASLVLSAVTIVVAVRCWTAGDAGARFVVLVLATLLVDPHVYAYDLLILAPALLVAWDWANSHGSSGVNPALVLAAFVYVAPIITIAVPSVPIQWSVVSSLLLGGLLSWSALREQAQQSLLNLR